MMTLFLPHPEPFFIHYFSFLILFTEAFTATCLVAIALQALFYPLVPFISLGVLICRLFDWKDGRLLPQERRDYLFCATGVGVALLAILPYMVASSEFGPTITANDARAMPDYWLGGRVRYFYLNPVDFGSSAETVAF
jgi:hypothetical protein